MGKKYRKPPIIEALCEFRFDPKGAWDLTIPGLIYERVKKEFPIRNPQRVMGFNLSSDFSSITSRVETTELIQFVRSDKSALIQVGPNLLTVNHLQPYSSWQEFKPLIKMGFDAYHNVTDPAKIIRIGLRYINRIQLKPGDDIEKFFEFRPSLGSRFPRILRSFIVAAEMVYENDRDGSRIQLANEASDNPEFQRYLLDIDYFLVRPEQVTFDTVFDWIETAHNHVEDLFEASITDPLRSIFQGEKHE